MDSELDESNEISFLELVERYGEKMSEELLRSLERSAGISVESSSVDKEQRLQNALDALNTAQN